MHLAGQRHSGVEGLQPDDGTGGGCRGQRDFRRRRRRRGLEVQL